MTCLTGVPPARHGIRDFITKARGSYLPTIGLFNVCAGRDGTPTYTSRRAAPTLGEHLRDLGRAAYILKVPGTFPPAPIRGGMLAGFGMPDLLGTFGVSAWYTNDEAEKKASAPEGVELVHPLVPLSGGTWRGEIAGPAGTKVEFALRRDGSQAVLSLGSDAGRPVAVLSIGAWSGWVRPAFDVPGRGPVDGLCRFKLVSLGPVVELYRTAVQCTPNAPLYPLAEPAGFAARLESLVGSYATLGMPADLDGVRRGVVDLDTFLEDAYANWGQQVEMTLRLMDEPSWDLLFTHLFTVDNVQHLFWHCQDVQHPAYDAQLTARHGDAIERAYRWLDTQLGRILERADPDVTLMVVSDHGGLPVYRLVYLNAWLQSQGYLAPREVKPEGTAARLDWDRTRAAMYGTGGVWLNVQGREPRGTVPPGAPYEALREEIVQALSSWRDPQGGQPVVKKVLYGEEVFGPEARENGPDLVLALQPRYGLGRGEGLGRVMSGSSLIAPNRGSWSGGHEGPYLPSDVPGICVLYGSRVAAGRTLGDAELLDIAPTVGRLLGLDIASGMVGRSLL
jgi:predicted AlkP superfamily phosphohydrolase/phosphomutase